MAKSKFNNKMNYSELTPELAEICGIHAGDGYLRCRERNRGEIQICGNLEEQGYYDNHVIPLFNNFFNLNIKGKKFSNIESIKEEYIDLANKLKNKERYKNLYYL